MGNGLSPCMHLPAASVKLVYWGGQTRMLADDGTCATAGDVTTELPGDHVVCAADSFYVGFPIPVMSSGEELLAGRAYFVLPAERFSCFKVLTAAALASLSPVPSKKVSIAGPGQCPFEYVKGEGGAALIRVLPEFIEKVISCDDNRNGGGRRGMSANKCRGAAAPLTAAATELCSTPELKRHYALLVGRRNQPWSPTLETIAECNKTNKLLRAPARLLSSR
ncbi:hypothetical protein E2562_037574 [Oryza meyeriana var. granulata]|uniref:Uncharacterized protein n=1 Tax=Oryza meyeriana var. granulata TaxID=110450 RepID=A0A6G1CLR9_9ORYZ|nr:hypothetical protein E2562_037574 [Oryza meyeriana var. granulata]